MSEIIVAKENVREEQEMRKAFMAKLIELAEKDPRIVNVDADLGLSIGSTAFKERFPEREIDCGIQESNMIGVACGLSVQGKIPFTHSFGPFATRRVADQVYMSGVYNKANVKMVGSDPGITSAMNGGTHMPFDDVAVLRAMPELTIIEPTDTAMLKDLLPKLTNTYGMYYIRLTRKRVTKIYEEGSTFDIGRAAQLRDGTDATIIAAGYEVGEALSAARMLEAEGIHVRVLDMYTIKPVDEEAICRAARETGCIVTAENHSVINGLGSAVSEVLVRHCPVPVEMVGVMDEFGEVGPMSYLRERFHLTDQDIAAAVKRVIARK